MKDKCPLREGGRCNVWIDNQVLKASLKEAEELADSNWKEIQWLYDRIHLLETTLRNAGLAIPTEK